MKEFKSIYKTVEGNEGDKCKYPTRLDTYGCGCSHNCKYCYARSLLEFRNLWDPQHPAVADLTQITRDLAKVKRGEILRMGGMTDCFQPCEKLYRISYNTIRKLNRRGIGYLIVTKSAMVADKEYMELYDPKLAHIQITITSTDSKTAAEYEQASPIADRIRAVETLQKAGFDVSVRLSPFIPEYVDFGALNSIDCDKILVEFLRGNAFIKKTFPIDWSEYTVKQGNYCFLPLRKKIELLKNIKFNQITVCEDETEAYEYWKKYVNHNPEDCCNLRR